MSITYGVTTYDLVILFKVALSFLIRTIPKTTYFRNVLTFIIINATYGWICVELKEETIQH